MDIFDISEETRCEFVVSTERKKLWRCLLEILSVIDDICKRHDISYFAIFGTLLGAVRHQGFIPWDDDLDIGIKRKDYDRFISIAQKEVHGKFFLQTSLTDRNYYREHARIRNSETTGISECLQANGCNNGIYVDIIPIEKYSDSPMGKFHSAFSRVLGRILYIKVRYKNMPRKTLRNKFLFYCGCFINLKAGHRFREWIEARNACRDTGMLTLGDVYYSHFSMSNLIYSDDDFDDILEMKFENTTIPCPVGYVHILETTYGDYMRFPPKEKRGKDHSTVFDTETPYKDYIREHYAK